MFDLDVLFKVIKLRVDTLSASGALSEEKVKGLIDHLEAAVQIGNGEELLTVIKQTDDEIIKSYK